MASVPHSTPTFLNGTVVMLTACHTHTCPRDIDCMCRTTWRVTSAPGNSGSGTGPGSGSGSGFGFDQQFMQPFCPTFLTTADASRHSLFSDMSGVLYVSSGHICFETSLFPAANTKLALPRITGAERCRDPIFHLIPNSVRLVLDADMPPLVFAAFHPTAQRDECIAMVQRCLKSTTK